MDIKKFRIKNFRSIVDTKWCKFSPDQVTVLVGQNESGKSAILDALSLSFSQNNITSDDIRYDAELPEISFEVDFNDDELKETLQKYTHPDDVEKITNHFKKVGHSSRVIFKWSYDLEDEMNNSTIVENYADEPELNLPATKLIINDEEIVGDDIKLSNLTADAIFRLAPTFTLFQSDSGLLPNSIDIDKKFKLQGNGSIAASNLLAVAEVNLSSLITADNRTRATIISRATNKLNSEFDEFWNQTIGKKNKIKIEFSLEYYNDENPLQSGKPYLLFWVSDGLRKLHPQQRSTGVRWFLSFYLQLKASQKLNKKIHFLLDEPGANLHSNAQLDVLKLINLLSPEIPITYTTHSPILIEHEKLFRVHAVQRANDDLETPTEIIEAQLLGAASSDTLSPILTAIGTDFSHQNVIKKNNNIILEEISGHYYLNAFWRLLGIKKDANFIAATGASKIPSLAYMFTGWGLNFSIVVDDENEGRGIYNKLKKELFGDDEHLTSNRIYKIKDCKGIEDIFTPSDFSKYVLDIEHNPNSNQTPSEVAKSLNYSKPVLAYTFFLKVSQKKLTLSDLDEATQKKIKEVTSKIVSLLY
ncbi:ATP-dependent nuclease [Pseudomonas fluorescens]